MADVDMIPRSYREGLRARRTLFAYGCALAFVLGLGGGTAAWVRWRLAVETPRLEQLRAATALAEATRNQLAAAQARKEALQQASNALDALRGSGAVARLAGSIDGAVNDGVWFDGLQFSRTQELLRDPLPQPLPAGTLQVQGAAGGSVEHWHLANRLEIAGQAQDNEAMSRFLDALSGDPLLTDVRFLNSSASKTDAGVSLAFSVAGALRPNGSTP
ncbi:PilN domain-containing protein [Massilia sp. IC2-476]|uniref:PilN domain-containing protein n=1 Tax=Massilia sp. IC2-476 TaxID=2887199 RepID=UPI001D11EF19|nr:PilN domain-containing protein [Massilia sp. IC2-476]MCC2972868.1 PilN domain-containing protein [Massilia sp. IC2-476]